MDAGSRVILKTSLGDITLELFDQDAPLSVANFLQYVDDKHYDGTIFHRVISGFMIQGGGLDSNMNHKPTRPAIKNEAGNGASNLTGTIAMARTSVIDSATCQFFINVNDNLFLDHTNQTPAGFGYAVFGHVVDGMDVVKKIEGVRTGFCGGHADVPTTPVVILSAIRA